MKIVHVSDCYLPRLGGIEVQVADLSKAQSDKGHEVSVITATRGEHSRGGRQDAGVHRVVAPIPFELPLHPRAGHRIGRALREVKPDVVHVHIGAISPFAWSGIRAAVRHRLPTVVTVHSMWDPATAATYKALNILTKWTEWRIVVTAVSEAAAGPIRSLTEVQVVSNGIDIAAWRTPPKERENDQVNVVAVGRLAPRKQPVTLLRLLRAAQQNGADISATIIGDGPARAAMQRYLTRHDMARWVTLAGRRSRGEIRNTLRQADIFVAPAPLESFGIAALEARIAGVPVVARRGSGVADFVKDGVEGLLGENVVDLAKAVHRLATDRTLRATIAEHNRAVAPISTGWPSVLDAFDRAYARAGAVRALTP